MPTEVVAVVAVVAVAVADEVEGSANHPEEDEDAFFFAVELFPSPPPTAAGEVVEKRGFGAPGRSGVKKPSFTNVAAVEVSANPAPQVATASDGMIARGTRRGAIASGCDEEEEEEEEEVEDDSPLPLFPAAAAAAGTTRASCGREANTADTRFTCWCACVNSDALVKV